MQNRGAEAVLVNVLDPNRVVGQPYFLRRVALKSGRIEEGLLHAEDPQTITLKGEKENHTAPVDAKATGALKTVKAGDKVTVTCWDNAKGEHEKVIAIVPAKAAAPAKQ
jgi:hypothetical protein